MCEYECECVCVRMHVCVCVCVRTNTIEVQVWIFSKLDVLDISNFGRQVKEIIAAYVQKVNRGA